MQNDKNDKISDLLTEILKKTTLADMFRELVVQLRVKEIDVKDVLEECVKESLTETEKNLDNSLSARDFEKEQLLLTTKHFFLGFLYLIIPLFSLDREKLEEVLRKVSGDGSNL